MRHQRMGCVYLPVWTVSEQRGVIADIFAWAYIHIPGEWFSSELAKKT